MRIDVDVGFTRFYWGLVNERYGVLCRRGRDEVGVGIAGDDLKSKLGLLGWISDKL